MVAAFLPVDKQCTVTLTPLEEEACAKYSLNVEFRSDCS